ncbi:hypothetical protein HAX54_018518 [Datura stramonium]|uniref:Uncharacterized protein n=1 Tax=Datura stramonium TaxID=4076 RepID=A0ABS8UMF2_DATST|nr:hypothetical protein [Datura stramonium]
MGSKAPPVENMYFEAVAILIYSHRTSIVSSHLLSQFSRTEEMINIFHNGVYSATTATLTYWINTTPQFCDFFFSCQLVLDSPPSEERDLEWNFLVPDITSVAVGISSWSEGIPSSLNCELSSSVRHPYSFVIYVPGGSYVEVSDLPLDVLIRLFLQSATISNAIHQYFIDFNLILSRSLRHK